MTLTVIGFFCIILLELALTGALIVLNISLLSFALSWSYDVPFVATPARATQTIGDALEIEPTDVVYDIGCGDGRVLCALARSHPHATYVGIDRNPLLILLARIRALLARSNNITFRHEDARHADFHDATKVYIYLNNSFIGTLRPALKTTPRLTRVVSRAYPIPEKRTYAILETDLPHENDKHIFYLYHFER